MGHAHYRSLWLGSYGVGLLADQAYYLALAWFAAKASPDPLIVGAITGIGALPRALFLLPGGMLADRWGAKPAAIGTSFLKGIILAGAALCFSPSVVHLVVIALLVGSLDALFLPAIQSMPWVVAGSIDVTTTQKLFSVVQRCGLVAGPILGGYLIAQASEPAIYGVLAAMFVVSACVMKRVKISSVPRQSDLVAMSGLRATLHRLLDNPLCRTLILLVAISELVCSGAFSTGVTLYIDFHGWSADTLGVLVACYGAGSVLGAGISLGMRRGLSLNRIIAGSLGLVGFGLIALALFPNVPAALLASGIAGIGAGLASAFLTASYLGALEPAQAATSMAVLSLASFGSASFSSLICGAIAQLWGAPAIFVLFGSVLLVVGLGAAGAKPLKVEV